MLSILEIYVKAHLTSSRKPLLSNTLDHFSALIEIAFATVELCQSCQEQNKPQATIMSEYYQKVRIALRKTDGMTLSVKSINALYSSATSSLISPIKPPIDHISSYLFANVRKEGMLSIGSSFQDDFRSYNAKLCHNALYLFHPPHPSTNNIQNNGSSHITHHNLAMSGHQQYNYRHHLFACIPLQNLRVERSFQDDSNSSSISSNALVELFDITGEKAVMILFQENRYQSSANGSQGVGQGGGISSSNHSASLTNMFFSSQGLNNSNNLNANNSNSNGAIEYIFDTPKSLEFFEQIALKIDLSAANKDKTKGDGKATGNHTNLNNSRGITNEVLDSSNSISSWSQPREQYHELEDWLDLLETCCWECTAGSNSTLI